jgi:hypothetical protein
VGLLTGWGEGVAALPADARAAAGARRVVLLARPALAGERFRRATRECLLGVLAVEALLRDAGLAREDLKGSETALVYATAGAYGPANLEFVVAGSARLRASGGGLTEERDGSVAPSRGPRQEWAGALHFPYTAPSAVPGEVAIEFGISGPYAILIGGATATLDALWQAARLVARGQCRRALVLAVETFAGCETLWRRGRWLLRPPLVEAAACALLVPGASAVVLGPAGAPGELETLARTRAGETLACAPLVALALGRAAGRTGRVALTGQWRDRRAGLALEAH